MRGRGRGEALLFSRLLSLSQHVLNTSNRHGCSHSIPHSSTSVDKDIGEFDIAMNDFLGLDIHKCLADLVEPPPAKQQSGSFFMLLAMPLALYPNPSIATQRPHQTFSATIFHFVCPFCVISSIIGPFLWAIGSLDTNTQRRVQIRM